MSLDSFGEDDNTLGHGAFAKVVGAGDNTVNKVYNCINEYLSTEINTMLTIRKNREAFYSVIDTLNFPTFVHESKSCLITLKSYDVNYDTDTATITMKKMDMTLDEFSKKYRTVLKKKWDTIVMNIAMKLGIALLEMTVAKIIHGDMKPDNVMLKFTNGFPTKKNIKWLSGMRLKLIDFNKSVIGYNVLKTTSIQTFYYSPPEIVLGDREYSYGVDMWAVGCIICELLIGKPVFDPVCASNDSNSVSQTEDASYSGYTFSYSDDEKDNSSMLHLWNQVIGPNKNPVGRFVNQFFHKSRTDPSVYVLNGDVLQRDGVGLHVLGIPDKWIPLMEKIFVYDGKYRINVIDFINDVVNEIE